MAKGKPKPKAEGVFDVYHVESVSRDHAFAVASD
ncbi:hypothetical protein CCACVL1_16690 [Corchorus capsularis]|uniref:Uncharacterized protein n=1 Tax=Corchorus capsularis TaxID=210143 RepID=A0A1R3HVV3_COCAP|nr:hypothetical protein CCACVL1_16690 [Corchorus capsularis]